MKKVVIFGLNDLAEIAWFYLTKEYNNLSPAAFTVNDEYITQNTYHNLPIVPFEELEQYSNLEMITSVFNEGIHKEIDEINDETSMSSCSFTEF